MEKYRGQTDKIVTEKIIKAELLRAKPENSPLANSRLDGEEKSVLSFAYDGVSRIGDDTKQCLAKIFTS